MRKQLIALLSCSVLLGAPCQAQSSATHQAKAPPGTDQQRQFTLDQLKRLKATTDVFDHVDALPYEDAIALLQREPDPEHSLMLREKMLRAYTSFCRNRCDTVEEKINVYYVLLLCSEGSEKTARDKKFDVLLPAEVGELIKLYKLPAPSK